MNKVSLSEIARLLEREAKGFLKRIVDAKSLVGVGFEREPIGNWLRRLKKEGVDPRLISYRKLDHIEHSMAIDKAAGLDEEQIGVKALARILEVSASEAAHKRHFSLAGRRRRAGTE